MIDEPVFEVADFICNPMPELLNHGDAPNITYNRVTHFAQILELPSQRIFDCCFVQEVLSWDYNLEDDLNPGHYKRFIGIINK